MFVKYESTHHLLLVSVTIEENHVLASAHAGSLVGSWKELYQRFKDVVDSHEKNGVKPAAVINLVCE